MKFRLKPISTPMANQPMLLELLGALTGTGRIGVAVTAKNSVVADPGGGGNAGA